MMTSQTAPAAQHDNLLGICHAIGVTFGFNPIYLRIALALGVMLSPQLTVLSYAVAGIAVLIATLATRRNRRAARRDLVAA